MSVMEFSYKLVKHKVFEHESLSPDEFRIAMLGNAAWLLYQGPNWRMVGTNSVLEWLCREIGVESYEELVWLYGGW